MGEEGGGGGEAERVYDKEEKKVNIFLHDEGEVVRQHISVIL